MLPLLVRAELRFVLRDRAFRIAALLFAIASLLSLADGAYRARAERQRIAALDAEEHERFETLARDLETGNYEKSDWSDLSRPAPVAVSPGARNVVSRPLGLALLTGGSVGIAPSAVRVSMIRDPFKARLDAIENPRHLLLGTFDFVFVIVMLLPLVVLSLTYDLVSGERERGTLTLLLAAPLPFERLLLARVAIRFGILLLLGAGSVGLAVSIALANGGRDLVVRGGLVFLVVASYAAFWFFAGVAVQRLRRSSRTNLLICLGIWLAIVVVLPAAVDVTLSEVIPRPSRMTMLAAARDAQVDAAKKKTAALASYYEDHPSLSGKKGDLSDFWINWVTQARLVDQAMTPIEARFDETLERRRLFVESTEIASPALCAESLLGELAGTGPARQQAFATQARAFDRRYRSFFEEKVLASAPFRREDVGAIPRFALDEAAATDASSARLLRTAGSLLFPTLVMLVLAASGARRQRWLTERHSS